MTQKDIAIACLEQLDIYKPYINKFKSKAHIPCFFERFAGFYADQEEILWNKIKAVEAEYGCLVYAITHEMWATNETWSMLCVPKSADCLEDIFYEFDKPRQFYAFSYVWNATHPDCSEFGDIIVQSGLGGVKRVY